MFCVLGTPLFLFWLFWGRCFGDALDCLDFCLCLTDGACDRYDYTKSPIRSKSNESRASPRTLPEVDHWLRRRVRMCYWKQWRWCRTKVRNLLKLGTSRNAAVSVGISRKGPWRLARTLATQAGMTNQWLKDQGLLSVKELWVKIHYPATAR